MNTATIRRPAPANANWRLRGLCLYEELDAMHPDSRDKRGQANAKAICLPCPVKAECLANSIKVGDFDGIRAAMTGEERKALVASGPTAPPMGCATCGQLRRNHTGRDHAWQPPSIEAIQDRVAHSKGGRK